MRVGWDAAEYDTLLGITKAARDQWLRPGGPLHGAPRTPGLYTKADVLIGICTLELRHALGERNPLVNAVMQQIQPDLYRMAVNGTVPDRLRLRIGSEPTEVVVDLCAFALLEEHDAVGVPVPA
jgi:hypothetical protein